MQSLLRILLLLVLLCTTAGLLTSCADGYYYIRIINDSPWDVFIEPFGFFLAPGDSADADIGFDIVRVVAIRHFDGRVLADVDMVQGDVLVIQ